MAVKVNDEPLNNLLSPKPDSQLLRANFLPQKFLCRRHLAATSPHFRSLKMGRCPKDRWVALKFFFCDFLTCEDIFDRHGGVVMQNGQTPLPSTLKGRSPNHPNINTCFADIRASGQDRNHPHALSFRKGANRSAEKSLQSEKGPNMPNNDLAPLKQGKVRRLVKRTWGRLVKI